MFALARAGEWPPTGPDDLARHVDDFKRWQRQAVAGSGLGHWGPMADHGNAIRVYLNGPYGAEHPFTTPTKRDRFVAAVLASVPATPAGAQVSTWLWTQAEPASAPQAAPSVVPAALVPPTAGKRVSEVLALYLGERKPPEKTADEWSRIFRRFGEFLGEDMPARAVTRAHVRDFKAAMFRMPVMQGNARLRYAGKTVPQIIAETDGKDIARQSTKTVEQSLNILGSVFSWAVANDHMDVDPTKGLKPAKREDDEEGYLPYESDELGKIFAGDVYASAHRDPTKRDAKYWLPLLAMTTGARQRELGQLLTADVKEEAGLPYLHFRKGGDAGKCLKNSGSNRRAPIHALLIRLGFLKYVAAMRAAKSAKLFPDLVARKIGETPTAEFSKWWSRYTRKLGVHVSRLKVFHSFRGVFKDRCRECDVPKDVHDRITGHSTGDEGDNYGVGFSVKALTGHVNRVTFPGVKLAH